MSLDFVKCTCLIISSWWTKSWIVLFQEEQNLYFRTFEFWAVRNIHGMADAETGVDGTSEYQWGLAVSLIRKSPKNHPPPLSPLPQQLLCCQESQYLPQMSATQGGQFAAGVVDIGGAPSFGNIFANFRNIQNGAKGIIRGQCPNL